MFEKGGFISHHLPFYFHSRKPYQMREGVVAKPLFHPRYSPGTASLCKLPLPQKLLPIHTATPHWFHLLAIPLHSSHMTLNRFHLHFFSPPFFAFTLVYPLQTTPSTLYHLSHHTTYNLDLHSTQASSLRLPITFLHRPMAPISECHPLTSFTHLPHCCCIDTNNLRPAPPPNQITHCCCSKPSSSQARSSGLKIMRKQVEMRCFGQRFKSQIIKQTFPLPFTVYKDQSLLWLWIKHCYFNLLHTEVLTGMACLVTLSLEAVVSNIKYGLSGNSVLASLPPPMPWQNKRTQKESIS